MSPILLEYDDVGSGPPVVLIHGHPFDRSMWSPQMESLADRFRPIAPDLRGYGQSPVTEGTVTMGEMADDVWALLGDLGVDRVGAVGLSMGGLIAMEMAIGHPERVWALGLVATTGRPVTAQERGERLALAAEVESSGMDVLVETMGPKLLGPHADEAVVAHVRQMMKASSPQGSAAALRGRAARPDYRDGLRGLDMPSLVCTGTSDVWSTAAITGDLVECLRKPRVVSLPGVGHLPNLESSDRFDAELLAFLDDAWARRR